MNDVYDQVALLIILLIAILPALWSAVVWLLLLAAKLFDGQAAEQIQIQYERRKYNRRVKANQANQDLRNDPQPKD